MLYDERHQLVSKVGISPAAWMEMPRWVRQDLLARHYQDTQAKLEAARKGGSEKRLGGLISALVSKIMGL